MDFSKDRINDVDGRLISDAEWGEMALSEETMSAIKEFGFHHHVTQDQARAILPLLEGKDAFVVAQAGYGKTIALLIVLAELVHRIEARHEDKTVAIIICPTRKYAFQTMDVALKLLKNHPQSIQLVTGGAGAHFEAELLEEGSNVLVATPDWLLHQLLTNKGFKKDKGYKYLKYLVIDEADWILEAGFEHEMQDILRFLEVGRQTVLFSSKVSKKVVDLASSSFQRAPVYVL